MKEGIHPKYELAQIACACGNVVQTKSTKGSFKVDICAACHPFFTGKQKLIDTAGRVERFMTKYANVQGTQQSRKAAKAERKATKA
jgi:large subunit ribosomal protein L31